MTARRATLEDIDRLVEMARHEHGISRFHMTPFEERKVRQSFASFIDGMTTVVFITEGGYIMGCVQPMLFSRLWNAYEMAWFAADGSGMQLLRALSKWAKDMRAVELFVHNFAGVIAVEKFNTVMGRFGFSSMGSTYAKQLGE